MFYRLYVYLCFVNVVTYLNSYIVLRLSEIPGIRDETALIESYSIPIRFSIMFAYTAFHLQNTGLLLLHGNRFTAIFLATKHSTIWQKYGFPLICLTIVYSFAMTAHIFFIAEVCGGEMCPESNKKMGDEFIVLDLTGKAYIGISTIVNVCTISRLFVLRKRGRIRNSRQERSLFIMSIFSFITQITSQVIISQMASFIGSNVLTSINSDVVTLSEAYIGIIFNRELRRRVKGIFDSSTTNVNVVTYLNSYLVLRVDELPGVKEHFVDSVPLCISITLAFTAFHLQNLGLLLLHANRFTAVYMPVTQSTIWRNCGYPLIMLSLIFSIAITYHIFFIAELFQWEENEEAMMAMFQEFATLETFGKWYLIVAAVINLCTIGRLFYLRKTGRLSNSRQERSLFIMSILSCLTQITSQVIIAQVANFIGSNVLTSLNSDVVTLSEAYIGIAFNILRGVLTGHGNQVLTETSNPAYQSCGRDCRTDMHREVIAISSTFVQTSWGKVQMALWLFAVYIVYGIPSMVLYFSIIIAIIRNRKTFTGMFYRIYVALCIVNVVTYFNSYIVLRLDELPGGKKAYVNTVLIRLSITHTFFAFHFQNIGPLMLHANRFTAVYFPITQQRFWLKFGYPLLALAFAFSVAMSYHIFFVADRFGFAQSAEAAMYMVKEFITLDKFGKAYILIAVITNVCTIARLIYLRKRSQHGDHRSERSLFIMSIVTCLTQMTSQVIISQMATFMASNVGVTINCDFLTLSEAYIGFIFNSELRKRVLAMYCDPDRQKKPARIVSVTSTEGKGSV